MYTHKTLEGTNCVDSCTAVTCTSLNCNSLDVDYVLNSNGDECILASNCPANSAIGIKNPDDSPTSFIYQC